MRTLYDFWRSSAAYRVRIGLHLKGVAYESAPISLAPQKLEQFSEFFRAKNPQARVPALESEMGVLTQSLAILDYLDETYPDNPFLPGDPWARARIRAFALTIACDVHPLNNSGVLEYLRTQFGADGKAVAAWIGHWITLGFASLEEMLARGPEHAYTFGDAPTLADICLVPQIYNARRFRVPLDAFPRLVAIDARAREHSAFAAAAPERQKDAEPQT
jgi:maleylpyruvate isomerase